MQEQKKSYQFSTGIIAGVSSVLIIAGGLAAWWAWTAIKGEKSPSWVPEQLQSEQPEPSSKTSPKMQGEVYWLKVKENQLELAAQPMVMKDVSTPRVALEQTLTRLLAGVDEAEYTSTIPTGTQLRSVSLREDGIHVDLSQEFVSGGGSTSMIGRVGQILYTATSIDPEAKVWLEVQGEPLEYLGGEGLYIPQPLTRDEFKKNYEL
jgi:spore germination protein GerM